MAAQDTHQRTTSTDLLKIGGQQRPQVYYGSGTGRRQQDAKTDSRALLLSKALGLFSIGLGLAQLLAPKQVVKLIGARSKVRNRAVMQALGLREIAGGVIILRGQRPVGGLRMRVLGDAMDLALLNRAMQDRKADHDRLALAAASVLGVTALDGIAHQWLGQSAAGNSKGRIGGIYVEKSITINLPRETVYGYWRNFQNLPRFMSHLESVQPIGGQRSHWKTRAPAGMSVEWDAEIVDDVINELISWRSVESAEVKNAGMVHFTSAPGGRGTEVHVMLRYEPPAGKLGATIAKLFGEEPEMQIADDLRAFKQVLETGEILHSDGAVLGERLKHRPAQPYPEDSSR